MSREVWGFVSVTNVDRVELTASQRGGWVAQRLVPESAAFGAGQLIWLNGEVDATGFAAAVERAFAETDALRVRFGDDDGVPFQYVDTSKVLQTKVIDSKHDDAQVRAMAQRQLVEMPLVSTEPWTCSTLVRRSNGTWAWLFTTNVLLIDGYGVSLFIRRVAEVYSTARTGGPVPDPWFGGLKEVVDAAAPGSSLDTSLDYWKGILAVDSDEGPDSAGSLSEVFEFSYEPSKVPLRDETYAQIQDFARGARVSWTDLLISLWGLYTASAEGRDYIAVRVPMMLRDSRESLKTPSAISRAIPVALEISPHHTFTAMVGAVANQLKVSRRHAVVEDHQIARLWPGGQTSYLDLPTVNIRIFESTPHFGDVDVASETISPGPVGALDLAVYRDPESGIRLEISATPAAGGSSSHAEQFSRFLDEAIKGSDARTLYELRAEAVLDACSRNSAWSVGDVVDVPESTLDGLIRAQADASPDAVAVVDDTDGAELTYAELDQRVNALAHLLVERGVRIGDRVGVLLPRTADLVVTLAAIIRAGAAYVPVDPEYPGERVEYIFSDARVAAVVSDVGAAESHGDVLAGVGAPVLRVDEQGVSEMLRRGLSEPPALERPLFPDDAVYTIYTSGTTGRPKGVQLSHRAVVNRLEWGRRELGFAPADRVLLKTAATFDVSVPEFFLPLIVGASIIVARDGMHGDPEYVARTLREHEITSVHFVPSMLQAFIDSRPAAGSFSTVRLVSFTGEALPAGAALEARRLFASAELFNLYGPTEAAIEIGSYDIAELSEEASSTPIGAPVSNSSFIVLDGWLRPVPVGVTGELYLGGVQLADGYVGRFGLTAERFIADPFTETGERLYRTGDLVRWNDRGELEYLGRSDDQVKVRGFRIELDEIRNVLEQHPGVSGAVVVALDHPAGGKFLAAYVTVTDGVPGDESVFIEGLRGYAAAALPEYMVPATVTVLDRFPVTANGKLDRRALPVPDLGVSAGTGGRVPETETEKVLAAVFADVLHLGDEVTLSLDDDFFRLGGHSLLATRVVARANAALGSVLTLREVFDHPTVSGLAAIIDGSREGGVDPALALRVGDVARPDVLPVSYGQQSLWLIEQLGGPGSRYVVPVVQRLSGELDEHALGEAVRDVVVRHEALRTLIVEEDGALRQVIVPAEQAAASLALVVEDLTGAGQGSVDARVTELVQRRFDLAIDIPVRAGLLRTGDAEWVLVLAVHHHAVDEWSFPSLLGDLSTAYAARVVGEVPGWAPLEVQYADYAIWQREVLGVPSDPDSELSRHLEYWREVLEDAPEESTIALDRVRPAEPTHRGEDVSFTIDRDVAAGLRKVADKVGVTSFVIAQAATALAVSALSGADDVVIGSPVGGRTADGVENLVGYFVNTLPIRHRLNPTDTLTGLLHRTRDTVLDGFAHQAAPFEQITTAVGVDRSATRNPLYQILLTHQVRQDDEELLRFGDATASPRPASLDAVKTDLDLYLTDTPTGITGSLSYATDLLDPGTVDRFIGVLASVLDTIATTPGQRVADLGLLPAGDRDQTTTWSAGGVLDIPRTTLDELIRSQAAATPDAVAIIDDTDGSALTFTAFDRRVNALTHALIDRGVSVGDRVGVLLPRSADLVVTLAAIIRAGAAYVPIDPEYPAERVGNILEDATPALVVTDAGTAATHAHTLGDAALVRLDDTVIVDALDQSRPAAPVLTRPLTPADDAYVIFTSGTTGRPKGVAIPHWAIVNRLTWGNRRLGLDATSVVLAKSGVGFVDASTELFGPLVAGATVRVLPDPAAKDPQALREAIREHQVTHLLTVPTLGEVLADQNTHDDLVSLRHWVSSGERLAPTVRDKLRAAAPTAVLHDFYGSTEVTGDATAAQAGEGSTSIGTPVTNTTTHVLDTWLRPVAPGVTGELYIGGTQLAHGYLNQTALTAERFVADPFTETGERLYRTGDLVRWNDRGELEYLGRSDDQVKVRGFRIEPDEIRNVLQQHPLVASAAVVPAEHPAGGQRLAAYVTLTGDGQEAERSIRVHLEATLPEYMIPGTITVLDALPTTPNGKLDRRALPDPQMGVTSTGGREASTPAEHTLIDAFRETLRLSEGTRLSVEDDFFRLGGDSILAARVAALAQRQGVPITLRDVFERRTVAGLAAAFEPAERADAEPAATPPSPTLSALRESGDDPHAWVLTESVTLPAGTASARVRRAFLGLVDAIDTLRLRVNPANKRLWLQDVLPPGAADATTQWIDAPRGVSIPELRKLAVERLDVLAGLPVAASASESDDGLHVVIAVHAAAADRRSVHELIDALLTDGPLPRFDSVVARLEAIDAAGAALDPSASDTWLTGLDLPADEGVFDGNGFAEFTLDGSPTVSAVTDAAARAAASVTAPPDTLHPPVAAEVDLRNVGASGEPEARVLGALTASYPLSHEGPLTDGLDPAEFPLLRYHNRVGRRALRRATDPAVLVTRQYGALPDPQVREGAERSHRVVVRYHLTEHATRIMVLGLGAEAATAFERRVREEIARRSPDARE